MKLAIEGREFQVDVAPGEVRVDGEPFKVEFKESSENQSFLNVGGMPYRVEVVERSGAEALVAVGGKTFRVVMESPRAAAVAPPPPARLEPEVEPKPEPKAEVKFEVKVEPPVEIKHPTRVEREAPVCDMPLLDGVTAVMPGRILSVKVTEGQHVKAGIVLCILEAMKMENEIRASKDGIVTNIQVKDGAIVNGGDFLMQVC